MKEKFILTDESIKQLFGRPFYGVLSLSKDIGTDCKIIFLIGIVGNMDSLFKDFNFTLVAKDVIIISNNNCLNFLGKPSTYEAISFLGLSRFYICAEAQSFLLQYREDIQLLYVGSV